MTNETRLGDGEPKAAGTWDYYGSLDPAHAPASDWETFSVGVFQWQAKWGKGTKKGKSVKRITGPVAAPHEVYEKALAYIALQAQGDKGSNE